MHTIYGKKRLLNRVRRIRGQLEGLERTLEQEADGALALQQIAAVRGAVNGLMAEVLEGHIREHLAPEARSPRQREDLAVAVSVVRSYLK